MALIEFNGGEYQELEDAKTLKAVMFLMIQEHVKSIPNDQELGARIRKIVNKFNKDEKNNNMS
jgi:methionine synthase II (cobalamin-independent)